MSSLGATLRRITGADREVAPCGCSWVNVVELDARYVTAVEPCAEHGGAG